MFDTPIHQVYDFAKQRQNELLRAAENERLIRQATLPDGKGLSFYGRSLVWLGRRLVAWGSWLQHRYGATPARPTLQCATQS